MDSMIPKENPTPEYYRRHKRRYEKKQKRKKLLSAALCVIGIIAVAFIVRSIVIKLDETDHLFSADSAEAFPVSTPVPEIPSADQQNDLLKIAINARGEDSKICYLTFDDGPTTEVTPAILDVLKQYNIPATFFMLGNKIEANPDIAKRVFNEGHLLANHSYSHSYDDLYASGTSFMGEIHKTESLIRSIMGCEPFKLMRFPGGGNNAGTYGSAKQSYKLLLQENGYYYADWNALNGDAEGGSRPAEQLVERIRETAKSDIIVVLLHDASTKQTTAEALPAVIEYLQSQGYAFKRLDEIKYYGGEDSSNTESPSMIM